MGRSMTSRGKGPTMLKRLAAACVLALVLGGAVQVASPAPPAGSFFCFPWFECPPCPFNLCW